MSSTILFRTSLVFMFALASLSAAWAQSSAPTKLEGVINDFTDVTNAAGAWHITGDWSAHRQGNSGKVDFVASLAMVRVNGSSAHTHHLGLFGADVAVTPTGYLITGQPALTTNGNAAFAGSQVTIEISGGNLVPASNVKITLTGPAAGHFVDLPLDGVVTVNR
jgi:hypothetical protein